MRCTADEPLIGSADIQSQAVLPLVAATLVPILPLVLTMIPLNELLKKLFGIAL